MPLDLRRARLSRKRAADLSKTAGAEVFKADA